MVVRLSPAATAASVVAAAQNYAVATKHTTTKQGLVSSDFVFMSRDCGRDCDTKIPLVKNKMFRKKRNSRLFLLEILAPVVFVRFLLFFSHKWITSRRAWATAGNRPLPGTTSEPLDAKGADRETQRHRRVRAVRRNADDARPAPEAQILARSPSPAMTMRGGAQATKPRLTYCSPMTPRRARDPTRQTSKDPGETGKSTKLDYERQRHQQHPRPLPAFRRLGRRVATMLVTNQLASTSIAVRAVRVRDLPRPASILGPGAQFHTCATPTAWWCGSRSPPSAGRRWTSPTTRCRALPNSARTTWPFDIRVTPQGVRLDNA